MGKKKRIVEPKGVEILKKVIENIVLTYEYTNLRITDFHVFECGAGWYGVIADLITDLHLMGWDGYISQVKQKFGTMRFYTGSVSEEMFKVIQKYEEKCNEICEVCGKEDVDRTPKRWIQSLCKECSSA